MPWGAAYSGAAQSAPAKGGGWGSAFQTSTPAPVAPASGGGGFFHDLLHNPVTHAIGQTATDLKNVAVNAPAGVYNVGKLLEQGTVAALTGNQTALNKNSAQIKGLGRQTVTQVKMDLQHPLRHPGYTLLDVLPVISAAGRVAEAGRIAKLEGASAGAKALVDRPVPPIRNVKVAGVQAQIGSFSRNPAARIAQHYIDQLRERFPGARVPFGQNQYQRVGKAVSKTQTFEAKLANAPFTSLRIAGKGIKWDSPEGVAMRAVAEGTPLETRIAAHAKELADAPTATARRAIQRQIKLALQAKKFVKDTPDGMKIADPKLAAVYEKTKAAALLEDQRLVDAHLMDPVGAKTAIDKPAQLIAGEGSGEFHVGYERRNKPFSINKPAGIGNANTIGIPTKPSRLRNELTGENFRQGAFRNDIPSLVADNAIESERYLATDRARQFWLDHAQDTPAGIREGKAVAIRTDAQGAKPFSNEVKDFMDAQRLVRQGDQHTFNPLGMFYDDYRQHIFPNVDPSDFEQYAGQVKWIDKNLLGGLNKPGPLASLAQHETAVRGLRTFDAINNAQKFAILYLKPAYALPNIVGNTFLNLVQQGVAAPANLTRAAKLMLNLDKHVGPEDSALIKDLMGEGIGGSLESKSGITAGLNNAFARHVFEPVVDTPFRVSSFLYEARRELGLRGPGGWKQLHDFLHDEARRPQLQAVVERANKAVIDYGDLTPVEQAIIRRVLFFYPWLKGSTRYAGEFLRDHPYQAGALGQFGQIGGKDIQQTVGALPSWAEGYFKVGGSQTLPTIVNPTSAGILSQPGQLAETLNQFVSSRNPQAAYSLASNLTPALAAAVATLSGKDAFTNKNVPRNAGTFLQQLQGGVPVETLVQRLTQDQSGKTFPVTHTQAVLQFLLGGLAPKSADRAKLNAAYAREQQPVRP